MTPCANVHGHRLRAGALLAALMVLASACGDADQVGTGTGSPADGGDAPVGASAEPLDCERHGWPCTWDEADPAAVQRTDELLAFAGLFLGQGASASELAARLEGAPGVAEVVHDPFTVWFRVEGAIPVTAYVDLTDGGQLEGAPPPVDLGADRLGETVSAAAPAGRFTGCPGAGESSADGERGPVGKAGAGKKALILGPWLWQMEWEPTLLRGKLQRNRSAYSKGDGGVTLIMTENDRPSAFGNDAAVRVEDFCGWERYDTIMLKTHGRAVCPDGATGKSCYTGLSVGRFAETADELRDHYGSATGLSFSTSTYGNLRTNLGDDLVEQCIADLEDPGERGDAAADRCLERLPDAGHIELTTDFFRANYPAGMPDQMVFISACQGMKVGDLGRALHPTGEPGAVFGFDRIVLTPVANAVMERFALLVGEGTAANSGFLTQLNDVADEAQSDVNVMGAYEGEIVIEDLADVAEDADTATRGSDIVSLSERRGGPELVDGGRVDVDGTPGDDQPDRLLLGVYLSGLAEDEHPDDYPVELLLDGAGLPLADLRWRPGSEEGAWEAELDADLGADLDPDATFDLEVHAELPGTGGAISLWVYRDIRVGALDPCTLVPTSVINDALGTAFDEPATMIYEGVPVPEGTCHWEEVSPGGHTVNVLDIQMWDEITYPTLAATAEAHDHRVDDLGDAAFFDPQSSGRATGTRYDDGTMGYSDFANFNLSTHGVWMLLQASGEIATDTERIKAGLTELAGAIVEHLDDR